MLKRLVQQTGPWSQGEDIILESPHPNEFIVGLGLQIPKSPKFSGSIVLSKGQKKDTHPASQLGVFLDGQATTINQKFLMANNDAIQLDNLNIKRARVRALQPLPANAVIDIVYESKE